MKYIIVIACFFVLSILAINLWNNPIYSNERKVGNLDDINVTIAVVDKEYSALKDVELEVTFKNNSAKFIHLFSRYFEGGGIFESWIKVKDTSERSELDLYYLRYGPYILKIPVAQDIIHLQPFSSYTMIVKLKSYAWLNKSKEGIYSPIKKEWPTSGDFSFQFYYQQTDEVVMDYNISINTEEVSRNRSIKLYKGSLKSNKINYIIK